jgi:hypothetical protein
LRKTQWRMASSKNYLPTQSELDVRTEKKLAVNLAQLAIIDATPPLVTALAHGAESHIAPVYKQK